jgi:hypothetical protein
MLLLLNASVTMFLQADLTDPTSLPATLVGISAIIDCATARPEESTQKVDWEGKVALIQCAQVRRRHSSLHPVYLAFMAEETLLLTNRSGFHVAVLRLSGWGCGCSQGRVGWRM